MQRYAIVKKYDETTNRVANKIRERLNQEGWVEDNTPDFVFAVGGDGTFLVAVHKFIEQLEHIHFVGIHTGTLGFLTDYEASEVDTMLDDVLNKECKSDEVRLLEVHINSRDEVYYSLNEMRVENTTKTQTLDIFIDDIFFETFRGTGICVATQVGSTAYNRSIKGAVIQHGLPLLQLSEIAGIHHREFQSLGNSIILKEDACITLKSRNFEGAILCYDNNFVALKDGTEIKCFNSDKKVRIAKYRPYHYVSRLKNLF